MTLRPTAVSPETSVGEVWRTMAERRFRHMPVVTADGRLAEILSQRPGGRVRRRKRCPAPATRARLELMHREIVTVRPNACAAGRRHSAAPQAQLPAGGGRGYVLVRHPHRGRPPAPRHPRRAPAPAAA
jgi:CBS-domain-containing membrane protein